MRRAGLFVLVVALTTCAAARADLVNKTIRADTRFMHLASLIDTQLTPEQVPHQTQSWEWTAAEKPSSSNPSVWVIEIRARHSTGPHSGEATTGDWLFLVLPAVVPGQSQPLREFKTLHPGSTGHLDRLFAEYRGNKDHTASELIIGLEHPQGQTFGRPGINGRRWITYIVVVITALAGGGWAWSRRQRRRA